MKFKSALLFIAASMVLAAFSLPARAEIRGDVFLPFDIEKNDATANIHFFVDTAGSMNQSVSGDSRNRATIAIDVIAGYKQPMYYGKDNELLYMPFLPNCEATKDDFTDAGFPIERWYEWRKWCDPNGKTWLGDKVDEFTTGADGLPNSAMVEIIRLRKDALGYSPDPLGVYFMFIYKDDAVFSDTAVRGALTTLDTYMRDMCGSGAGNTLEAGEVCTKIDATFYLRSVTTSGTILLSDGTDANPYEIFTASDSASSTITYYQATLLNYQYYDSGITAGSTVPTWTVVPVAYQAPDPTAVYTAPDGITSVTGKCYYNRGKFADCYWPVANTNPSNYFVIWTDYSDPLSSWMYDNDVTLQDWYYAHGSPSAYCTGPVYEVWGDGDNWKFFKGLPLTDGINPVQIYYGCDSSDPNKVLDMGVKTDADDIKNAMIAKLPYVTSVDIAEPSTVADLKEFTMGAGADRMDVYLRTALGISPATMDITNIDLYDPWFGDFFDGLYYTQVFKLYPGIIDRYPDKNYGFSIYDKANGCYDKDGNPDDFPGDDIGDCVGMDLLWNPPSYCEYATQTCTAGAKNAELQNYLRSQAFDFGGGSPVSSFLHQFFRYFYNLNMVGFDYVDNYPHPTDTTDPTSFYTLPPPDDITDVGNATMRHVIQGDPNYINECRRNFLIMIVGNAMTGMGEVAHGPSNDPQQSISYWAKRVAFGPPSDFFASGAQPSPDYWHDNAGDPYGVGDGNPLLQEQEYKADTGESTTDYSLSTYDYRLCTPDPDLEGRDVCRTYPLGVRVFWIFFGDDSNSGALNMAFYSALSTFDEHSAHEDEVDYDPADVPRFPDIPKHWTYNEWITSDSKLTDFLGYGYPFAVNNEVQLDSAISKIMTILSKGTYARTAPEVSTGEQAITGHYFDVDPKYPIYKGHLMAYSLQAEVIPGSSPVDYYYPAMWSPIDAGEILKNTPPADREILVSRFTPALTDGDISDVKCKDMEPYITCGTPGSTVTYLNSIGIVKNDPGVTFKDGTVPSWPLGGIYHSRPRIIPGTPNDYVSRGLSGYSDFSNEIAATNRPSLIYVGTMMGVLHAFALNGSTDFTPGGESFAYVPADMMDELPKLYNAHPMYGVDGIPTSADLYFPNDGGASDKDKYHSVLAFGLGGGGKAYYALDVTRTTLGSSGRSDNVSTLWGFTDSNLGYTWSLPLLHYANSSISTWVGQPAMFFGGGLQNAADVNDQINPAYGPVDQEGGFFYVIDAEDGTLMRKFELFDKTKIGTNPGSPPALTENIGYFNHNMVPGTPVFLDLDNNYTIDWGYVGDYQGRVWKFNMKGDNPADWTHCIFYDTADMDGDGSLNGTDDLTDFERQPVWYRPEVALGPNGQILVYFGTGDIELDKDGSDETKHNYYYAVVDQDPTDSTTDCSYGQLIGDSVAGGTTFWPIELEAGEKVVTPPIIAQKVLYFKTWLPATKTACSVGESRLYVLDYLTGEGLISTPDGMKSYKQVDAMGEMILIGGELVSINPKNPYLFDREPTKEGDKSVLSWGEGIQY